MKILWFSHRDVKSKNAGGAEKTIYELGRRFVKKGYSVTWVSVKEKELKFEDQIDGINIKRMEGNLNAHLNVGKIIKLYDPDFIIDDLGHVVPWLSERITKIPGIVFFRHLHKRSLKGQVRFPLMVGLTIAELSYPIIYRKWEFITESESSKNDLVNLGINKNRINIVSPGVDNNLIKININKDRSPTLVYFGGFRDYKRPWVIVQVLEIIKRNFDDIKLKMIGDGPSLEATKKIAKNLKIKEAIEFMGKLPDEKLYEEVAKSWVNIHTSRTEGYGYSILESSALGTPTVAFSVPGVRDSVLQGKNGILVKDNDIISLANAIIGILQNGYEKWYDSCKKHASEHSWDIMANLWEEKIIDIIKKDS